MTSSSSALPDLEEQGGTTSADKKKSSQPSLPDFKNQVCYAPGEQQGSGQPQRRQKQPTEQQKKKPKGQSNGPEFKHKVQSVVRQDHQGHAGPEDDVESPSPPPQNLSANLPSPGAFRIEPPWRQTSLGSSEDSSSSSSINLDQTEVPVVVQRANSASQDGDALLADVVPECKCFCRCERYKVLWALSILATFLVALAIFLGAFCGTGNCGNSSSKNGGDGEGPTLTRDPAAASAIAGYINNITLSGTDIVFPVLDESSATPEELALRWLIEADPLQLTMDTEAGRYRLAQRFALATLYFSLTTTTTTTTTGPPNSWTESTGWLDANECRWFGISCDSKWSTADTVTKVDLRSNNLHGLIPKDIGLLTSLTVLDLQQNSVGGTIPESILLLTKLDALNLSNNLIAGTIPENFGSLSRLTFLDFGNNVLSGTIPTSVGNLVGLVTFGLYNNQFTGPLFERIDQLSNLRIVWADSNALSGSLPKSMGLWTNMNEFAVNNNDLTGSLPETIGQWTGLTDFRINDNTFRGSLPESIGQWASLKRFWVHNNAFVDALPNSIGQMISLETFNASGNFFNETIPNSIGNWSSIREVRLYGNDLTGTVPTSICNVSSLSTLDVDCAEVKCSCCKKNGVKICD